MHPIVKVGFAVDNVLIEAVIESKQTFADPCRRYSEGFNVHEVSGSVGKVSSEGYFTVFIPGKFLFAIRRKTTKQHFPNTLSAIDQAAERRNGEEED